MGIEQKSRLILFPRIGKFIIIFIALAFIVVGIRAYKLYRFIFDENVKNEYVLIIPENSTYEQITDSLTINDVLINYKAFKWVAKKKSYPGSIKPGRYLIKKGMNSNQIVNILRGGIQQPVNVTFNNIRLKEDLAGKVSKYIIADSLSILNLFSDETKIAEFGFNSETFSTMFIPNTYELYWTTTADDFAERMNLEYKKFWNDTRKKKAELLNLTQVEVSILASIVQAEVSKKDELKRVAGLYVNRLKRGIMLQADPTVKFAIGNFSLKRVLNKHLEIDSPYNTYKFAGLPPGPINFPEISSINAVLDYEKHNYIYMCAKEDFSGYHNFASTLSQHNRNAAKYRATLNANRIYE